MSTRSGRQILTQNPDPTPADSAVLIMWPATVGEPASGMTLAEFRALLESQISDAHDFLLDIPSQYRSSIQDYSATYDVTARLLQTMLDYPGPIFCRAGRWPISGDVPVAGGCDLFGSGFRMPSASFAPLPGVNSRVTVFAAFDASARIRQGFIDDDDYQASNKLSSVVRRLHFDGRNTGSDGFVQLQGNANAIFECGAFYTRRRGFGFFGAQNSRCADLYTVATPIDYGIHNGTQGLILQNCGGVNALGATHPEVPDDDDNGSGYGRSPVYINEPRPNNGGGHWAWRHILIGDAPGYPTPNPHAEEEGHPLEGFFGFTTQNDIAGGIGDLCIGVYAIECDTGSHPGTVMDNTIDVSVNHRAEFGNWHEGEALYGPGGAGTGPICPKPGAIKNSNRSTLRHGSLTNRVIGNAFTGNSAADVINEGRLVILPTAKTVSTAPNGQDAIRPLVLGDGLRSFGSLERAGPVLLCHPEDAYMTGNQITAGFFPAASQWSVAGAATFVRGGARRRLTLTMSPVGGGATLRLVWPKSPQEAGDSLGSFYSTHLLIESITNQDASPGYINAIRKIYTAASAEISSPAEAETLVAIEGGVPFLGWPAGFYPFEFPGVVETREGIQGEWFRGLELDINGGSNVQTIVIVSCVPLDIGRL